MTSSIYTRIVFLLIITSVINPSVINGSVSPTSKGGNGRCEEINIPMCKGIGYNATSLPNMFHHDSQEEAGLEVHQFWPLVEIQCSDDLRFFLCSMYTPICIEDYHKPLPACRSVCNRAKSGCAPIMSQYGFGWPDRMNCDELPAFGDQNNLCMDSKNGAEPTVSPYSERFNPSSSNAGTGPKSTSTTKIKGPTVGGRIVKPTSGPPLRHAPSTKPIDTISPISPSIGNDCKCECRPPLMKLDDGHLRFFNRVETGGVMNCGQPCKSMFFKSTELAEAAHWINFVAIACFICTFLIVTTYAIDTERFKYPEVSIVYMSGCYLMISMGFLVKNYFGHSEVACDSSGLIRYQGMSPAFGPCLLVFILFYFFSMAACVWWVILCLTWFLAAGMKWGSEAIAGYAPYFHFLALSIPTIKSLLILGMGAIDGDPFSGICSVGNLDSENLKKFILIPFFGYMLLGGMFLLAGFFSLFRVRKVIRQQVGNSRMKTDKLEKLMIRIVIFSVLYVIPSSVVISCYYYEYKERVNWERQFTCGGSSNCINNPILAVPLTSTSSISHHQSSSSSSFGSSPNLQSNQMYQSGNPLYQQQQLQSLHHSIAPPSYLSFLSKYICSLVVGITSLFWILSPKTIDSWSRFICRCCGCGGSRSTVASVGGRSSTGGQLIGSQYIPSHRLGVALNGNGSVYKQMVPINQQLQYSSTSHIGSDSVHHSHNHHRSGVNGSVNHHHPGSIHLKQVPLSHV